MRADVPPDPSPAPPAGADAAWPVIASEQFDPAAVIPFVPVPRLRARRRGWSAERQQLFIFILSRCGSVARSAKAVGMSARSAYQLLDAPGADGFAAAWDQAIDEGVERVRVDALERALGGVFVPVIRRGKVVRVEYRHCDRLAIALLSGERTTIDEYRHGAAMGRQHRLELKARDTTRADERRQAERVWAEHQAILDAIAAGDDKPRRAAPRISRL